MGKKKKTSKDLTDGSSEVTTKEHDDIVVVDAAAVNETEAQSYATSGNFSSEISRFAGDSRGINGNYCALRLSLKR